MANMSNKIIEMAITGVLAAVLVFGVLMQVINSFDIPEGAFKTLLTTLAGILPVAIIIAVVVYVFKQIKA